MRVTFAEKETQMASTATLNNILDEAGFKSERGRAMLIGTAKDIMKRIDRNFQRLHISPYNKQGKMRTASGVDASGRARGRASDKPLDQQRGALRRSIHWQIFNATGGDDALIKFYTQNVTSFVELAVQGDMYADDHKGWKVRHGGLPKQIRGAEYHAIDVNRVNDKGKMLRRQAKPFISGEIRVHGRMLFDRLIAHCAYVGNVIMASALVPRSMSHGQAGMLRDMKEIMGDVEARLTTKGWNPGDIGSFTKNYE